VPFPKKGIFQGSSGILG